jgi:hypothetical protein
LPQETEPLLEPQISFAAPVVQKKVVENKPRNIPDALRILTEPGVELEDVDITQPPSAPQRP